ncbi:unnamed protein product [Clonostachys rosea f. rosea IK726]|uniref:Uncharacterized protein n=1 Tax=Clonostachys rosea f. rosea IK726 TaxID=1349383 RepID=A0ACA9TGE2_BIOOC|nr:unnamed protein product [Clonostachys rosea f. rosea IK726]
MNAAPDKDNGHHHSSPGSVGSGVGRTPHRQLSSIDDRDRLSELSMGEAHVAGISHQDGCVSSVHGLTSVMNSTSGAKERGFLMTNKTQNHHARAAIKDRLMSYAALQSQRETWVYNQPDIHIDLDGCDVDLAKHLIDLHFNIQHYTYLISYRPAIIDSLASGGGPWCNKLLLNAIYYSSSLFSDRPCFREDPKGPKNIGSQFYNRFYQLLGPEIVRPSIPSAVGLLLMSASLVSHGRASAGWNLSGIAYRMVIDLGCHLTLGPGHQGFQSTSPVRSSEGALNQDLEQEMRKRLYWGAFATDATQSLYLGRPCMLAPIEARVPFEFLDTFEELEKWEPYMDHDPQTVHLNPPTYAPQPAHAVSTFSAVARLLQISTRIGKLYGIGAIKCSSTDIQCDLVEIEKELQEWSSSLPGHLHFDVETCQRQAPPPHKINPHTTFHALNILLHRAFLEDGHLYHHSDSNITTRSEEACLHSALLIENFLRALRDTFTLRGGPFLLCYATYSAVSIVLRAERHNRGRYLESISFFWTCLSEMQRGCNFGMTKPLAILKEMVREYNISIRQNGISMDARNSDSDIILTQEGLDQSFFELTPPPLMTLDDSSTMPLTAGDYVSDLHDFQAAHSGDDWLGDGSASNFATYLDEQEQQLWRDTLYGLFTSTLPFG